MTIHQLLLLWPEVSIVVNIHSIIFSGTKLPEEMIKETVRHFEDFYEEVFLEMANFGEVEDLVVCDNIGDHIIGSVYVKFYDENDAERAMKSLSGRYYAGKLIMPEYSPVTNFRDAKCRQYEEGSCSRKESIVIFNNKKRWRVLQFHAFEVCVEII